MEAGFPRQDADTLAYHTKISQLILTMAILDHPTPQWMRLSQA